MPTWILIRPDGLLEYVGADHCERTRTGWDLWAVVLIINTPRWSCVRRVIATDVIGVPIMLPET